MSKIRNAKDLRRQVVRRKVYNSVDIESSIDLMKAGAGDTAHLSRQSAPPAIITVTERVVTADHSTAYVQGLVNDGCLAHPQRHDATVNKYGEVDRDYDTLFYAGPRYLFEGTGVAPSEPWQPLSLQDARAIDPLRRPDVLLTSTGGSMLDMDCPMSLDIKLKFKFDHTQKVQTKLRSMLRPNEEGWKRGGHAQIGHVRINHATYATLHVGDSRNHPAAATGKYWDGLASNLQKAVWFAIRDTYRVMFDSGVTDASGVMSDASQNEPFVQMHSHTNTMHLERDAETCLRLNPNAVFRIEKPAIFFRLLSLHATRLNVCVSIGIFSHGHKYNPSQTGPQFCVPETGGQMVGDDDMRAAYESLAPFVQKSWADAGWKPCIAAIVEALGDEVRYAASFGMYISGLMQQVPDGEESPWLMAMLPPDRLQGKKGTSSRPFAYPVQHETSVTVEAPAGTNARISLRFGPAQGDSVRSLVQLAPEDGNGRPTQMLCYHPGSQLHRAMITKFVLARLTNTNDSNPELSERHHREALNIINDYVDEDLRRDFAQVRALFCAKRWETNYEFVVRPGTSVDSLQQWLVNALCQFVYCCFQLPSLHFLRGASDMVRHSRMKLTCMVKLCVGLKYAVAMGWIGAAGRTKFTRNVMAPQISGAYFSTLSFH